MQKAELRQKTIATGVFEIVRNAIILGEFAPGSLHSVQEIAAKLNVSRTPVREALLKLEEQGMVAFERNRGARILKTTVHDLEEIFSLRVLLEVPAAFRAARIAKPGDVRLLAQALDEVATAYRTEPGNARAHLEPDARFHHCVALIAGSRRLANMLDALFDQQMVARGTSVGVTRSAAEISHDHQRIFDAIAAGDPPAAAQAMRHHLVTTSRALVAKETGDLDAVAHVPLLFPDVLDLGAPEPPEVRALDMGQRAESSSG